MKSLQGIGRSFDDFLQEEGILAEAEVIAVKRIIAFQLKETMAKEHITKKEMAKRIKPLINKPSYKVFICLS